MADEQDIELTPPALGDLADSIVAKVLTPQNLEKLRRHGQELGIEEAKDALEFLTKATPDIVAWAVGLIIRITSLPGPLGEGLARAGMDTLIAEGGPREQQGAEVGRRLIARLSGDGGPMQPGYAGAAGFLGLVASESIEAWARAIFVEATTSLQVAGTSLGDGVDAFGRLQDVVEQLLGGGRLVRQVLGPIIRATAVTPATWHSNKIYRPELLSAAATIEAYLAGRLTDAQLVEELARQGWSDERINVQVGNARKRLTFEEWAFLFQRGGIADTDVVAGARELGFDEPTARAKLRIAQTKQRERWTDPIVDAAVSGFVGGDIDEAECRRLVDNYAPSVEEATFVMSAARVRRGLRTKTLSPADERRLVIKGIRSVVDFRRALERDGFTFEAVAALELELMAELAERRADEQLRTDQAADRAAEQAAAAAAKTAREAELAQRRALPTLQEYRRAYVRGFLSRDTFAAALVREKVAIAPDDLAILLADADADREQQLADQERRAAVQVKRDTATLSLAQLEGAVLAGILTLPEFDARLAEFGYDDDERRVIVALLGGRQEDRAEAIRRRDQAAAAAEVKSISLPAFERAVRLGVRTRAQYAALLDQVEPSDVARALILDLLDREMADDAAARATRDRKAAAAPDAGLSLAQRRRAVVAGVRPLEYYEQALLAAGWSADDVLVERELVTLELTQAAAARARRDEIAAELDARREREAAAAFARGDVDAATTPPPTLTLAQMERAVKLGILPPSALRAYLFERGYAEVDVETIVSLVVADVPDVRRGQELEARVTRELAAKRIALADLKNAVKRGIRTLADYALELRGYGYGDDDVALLEQLLAEEVAIDLDGLRKRIAAVLTKAEGAPALTEIEAAFAAGEIDVSETRDLLAVFGVPREAALVFSRLLLSFGAGS